MMELQTSSLDDLALQSQLGFWMKESRCLALYTHLLLLVGQTVLLGSRECAHSFVTAKPLSRAVRIVSFKVRLCLSVRQQPLNALRMTSYAPPQSANRCLALPIGLLESQLVMGPQAFRYTPSRPMTLSQATHYSRQ